MTDIIYIIAYSLAFLGAFLFFAINLFPFGLPRLLYEILEGTTVTAMFMGFGLFILGGFFQ